MAKDTPRLYMSDQPNKPKGCWVREKTNPTGEVRSISSTSYKLLLAEEARVRRSRKADLFWQRLRVPFSATLATDYRTRSQPVLSLDESALAVYDTTSRESPKPTINLAEFLGATEIPDAYHKVVVLVCKRDYFLELAAADSTVDLEQEITRHYKRLIKMRVSELARSGSWLEKPRQILSIRQATVIEELNQLVLHGLGFEHDIKMITRDETTARANPLVQQYLAASPLARLEMWERNHGALGYLLTKARVPTPGKYRRST
jgi:hypothetical protein